MLQWSWSKLPHKELVLLLAIFSLSGLWGCKGNSEETLPQHENAKSPDASTVHRSVDRIEWPDEPLDGTPVVSSFMSIVRSSDESLRAKVRFFNFTELNISQLEMEISCHDEDGRSLVCVRPWKTTRNVPARSHMTHVIGAHLPSETYEIEVTMKSVRFEDGTQWPVGD